MTHSDGKNENLQLVTIRLEMDRTTAEAAQDLAVALAAGSILVEVEEPPIFNRDEQVRYSRKQWCVRAEISPTRPGPPQILLDPTRPGPLSNIFDPGPARPVKIFFPKQRARPDPARQKNFSTRARPVTKN